MRPLPAPFDDIAAGRPARIGVSGPALLGSRLLTKDLAFPDDERAAFRLHGLLPARTFSIEEQMALELEHLRVKHDDLERYIGLAALQDRNATLFYRLLAEHLDEFLPIVYTPTVGRACQEFSHILRRTRGTWITPDDINRIPEILRQGPFEDVRLIVVTDNERILGLGDQGAGGMAIPIGKLALYTAACGIHPSLTLPVSLDVGTDNPWLLDDPLYLGYRAPRLRGAAYDALVEAFISGVEEVWPGVLVQFEDFKQQNALRLLDRYQDRLPSFNDDIQGTAAVVVAGVLTAMRAEARPVSEARVVLVGAGAAGIGIARLLRLAGVESVALVDTTGLVHAGRVGLDPWKAALAVAAPEDGSTPDLIGTIAARRPNVLVGTTGAAGTFSEAVVAAMDERLGPTERPVILPLSNPTAVCEATPADVLDWTGGRALVATGSPFAPVERDGRTPRHRAGQQRVHLPGCRSRGDRGRGADRDGPDVPSGRARTLRERDARTARVGRALPADLDPAGHLATDRDRRGDRGGRRRRGRRGGRHRWRDVVARLRSVPAAHAGGTTAPRGGNMTTIVRAAVLGSTGEAAVVRDLELIEPRAGEVRVRMLASGVCHSDLHVRDGEWERPTPIVMGHEGAGVIEALGPGVTTLRVGQLVALSWLIPCGVCRSCRRGHVWACPDSPSYRHALLDGETPFRVGADGDDEPVRSYCAIGTMAEANVVPAAAAIPLPDGTDPAVAALIGCCVTTGVGAVLKTAAVPAGASVAVIGLGGVGLSCVMGAVVAGAERIVAIDRVATKLAAATSVGATDTLLAGRTTRTRRSRRCAT